MWGLVKPYFGPPLTEKLRIWRVIKNIKSKISKIEDFEADFWGILNSKPKNYAALKPNLMMENLPNFTCLKFLPPAAL